MINKDVSFLDNVKGEDLGNAVDADTIALAFNLRRVFRKTVEEDERNEDRRPLPRIRNIQPVGVFIGRRMQDTCRESWPSCTTVYVYRQYMLV